MQPRYLLAAALLTVLTLAPLGGWAGNATSAYAQPTSSGDRPTTRVRGFGPFSLLTVVQSNENEQKEQDDKREHGNNANNNGNSNGNDNNSNNNRNGNNNNDNHDEAPPPPAPRAVPAPPADQVSACLSSGGSVSLTLPDGTVTMKVFQDNLNVDLSRVDPGSVPPPPGGIVASLVFRLGASPCGGSGLPALPGEGNLGVAYRNRAGESGDKSKFTLMFWDGQNWVAAPKQARDPGNNYVSATITALGIYAVVPQ